AVVTDHQAGGGARAAHAVEAVASAGARQLPAPATARGARQGPVASSGYTVLTTRAADGLEIVAARRGLPRPCGAAIAARQHRSVVAYGEARARGRRAADPGQSVRGARAVRGPGPATAAQVGGRHHLAELAHRDAARRARAAGGIEWVRVLRLRNVGRDATA